MERIFTSNSPAETEAIAADLSKELHGFIALYGRMGAGKTAFVRGFVGQFLPSARVSSPTYTVMNAYSDELYHLDLYRLSGEDDLESIGFFDIPQKATVLCEWAEHLPNDIHVDYSIYIEPKQGDQRIIKVVH